MKIREENYPSGSSMERLRDNVIDDAKKEKAARADGSSQSMEDMKDADRQKKTAEK